MIVTGRGMCCTQRREIVEEYTHLLDTGRYSAQRMSKMYLQLFAVLVAARQLRTALFAREIRKIPHTEASSPAYILGYMR